MGYLVLSSPQHSDALPACGSSSAERTAGPVPSRLRPVAASSHSVPGSRDAPLRPALTDAGGAAQDGLSVPHGRAERGAERDGGKRAGSGRQETGR